MAEETNNSFSPKLATLAIHGGDQKDKGHNALIPPIVTSTSFIQKNIGVEAGEFCYSRCGNPTRRAYETCLASIEGGIYATATASGVAAISLAVELVPKDSSIVVMKGVYGGTHRLFEDVKRINNGIKFEYIDLNNAETLLTYLSNQEVKMLWIETPTNPLLNLVDIEKVCSIAKERNVLTCVDNTFATAWNQQPLRLGADIVMMSSSKYIGGHSDLIGGALVTSNVEIAKRLDFLKTAVGAIASPFDSYLALRGLKTLHLRMQRQCQNAEQIAKFLEAHPKVIQVSYPGLSSHKDYHLCRRQMKSGGAVVTVRLSGELKDTKRFLSKLQYFVLAESLGGVESMINHSASMSHHSMTKEERESIGVFDSTLRISVGAEAVEDLIQDLEYALK